MLKFFLVAHLTYENQWVSLRNKIQNFGFFGTPYSACSSQVEVGEGRFVWALVSRIWEEQATSERVPGIGRI